MTRYRPALPASILLATLLLCNGTSRASDCNTPGGTCLLGVFPHTSIAQIEATYSPIAEELSLLLDREVLLQTSRSTETFGQRLGQRLYDLALAGIGQFLIVAEPAGYTPVARRETGLIFEVVVRSDSGLRRLSDLRGKRMGRIPSSQGTTLVVNRLIAAQSGLADSLTNIEFGSQQACIHALIAEIVDACGLAMPVKSIFEAASGRTFRVLARSQPAPGVSWVVSPTLAPSLRAQIRDYFLQREGFVPVGRHDYDRFRENIGPRHP